MKRNNASLLTVAKQLSPSGLPKNFHPNKESANIVRLNFDKCAIIPPNGCDSRTLQKIHTSPTDKRLPRKTPPLSKSEPNLRS